MKNTAVLKKSLRTLACATLTFALPLTATAAVVRPAPDFAFAGIGGTKTLRSLRGQPIIVLAAPSPKSKAFRKQVTEIEAIYREFASRGAVFVAAFADGSTTVASNVPFIIPTNGPAVANAYGLTGDLLIGIVGRDGNLDLLTGQLQRGLRLREVIQNSYAVQHAARKDAPKGPPSLR